MCIVELLVHPIYERNKETGLTKSNVCFIVRTDVLKGEAIYGKRREIKSTRCRAWAD